MALADALMLTLAITLTFTFDAAATCASIASTRQLLASRPAAVAAEVAASRRVVNSVVAETMISAFAAAAKRIGRFSSSVAMSVARSAAAVAEPVNVATSDGSVHMMSNDASASHAALQSASAMTSHSPPSQRGAVNMTSQLPVH